MKPSPITLAAIAVLLTIAAGPAAGADDAGMPHGAAKTSDSQLIKSAMRAAPAKVSADAAIIAAGKDGKMRTLREGKNGFTCMPDNPATPGPDPMCMDKAGLEWAGALIDQPPCPACGVAALRPDIVWFGEMPYQLRAIDRAIGQCELFVAIGTSGSVYPAAGYVEAARRVGAHCLEINLQPTEISRYFHDRRYGRAGDLVPEWVDNLLKMQQNTP